MAGGRGRKKYRVMMEGEEVAHFPRLTDAVEAVDYELARMGETEAESASEDAEWRQAPVPQSVARTLSDLRPPRNAENFGDALALLVYDQGTQGWQTKERGGGWPEKWKGTA